MKKKLTAVALIVCMLAIMLVGASLAYFTDDAEAINTFSVGNVGITLSESTVTYDEKDGFVKGELTEISEKFTGVDYSEIKALYPGAVVPKDPTIEVTGDNDAWIAAKVTVTGADLMGLLGVNDQYVGLANMVTGGLAGNGAALAAVDATAYGADFAWEATDYILTQDVNAEKNEYVFTYYLKEAKAKGSVITLFDTLLISEDWDNDEMAMLKDMKIVVKAYAVQVEGFDDCYTAMTTAFESEF